MAKEKKTVHKVQMTKGKRQIIQQLPLMCHIRDSAMGKSEFPNKQRQPH